jgi:hypothetical protein
MTQKFIVTINTPGGIKGRKMVSALGVKEALKKRLCYDEEGWFNGRTIHVQRIDEKEDEK